jgi:peptidoglycan/xylan/chitin deacetylase (PgdA/CDA1 family)
MPAAGAAGPAPSSSTSEALWLFVATHPPSSDRFFGKPMKPAIRTIKSFVRDTVGETLRVSGLSSPALWANDRLTIVTFHRVLPPALLSGYPLPAIAVTPEELDHFVAVFQKHYTVGSLHAMMQLQASGGHVGKPLLAITFDDGQLDNFLFARPVLQSRGVQASFFVVSAAADDGELLWHDRMAFALHHALARECAGLDHWLKELGIGLGDTNLVAAAVMAAKRLTPAERALLIGRLEQLAGKPARPEWDGMMNRDHILQILGEGHEIGSHSSNHPILPLVDDDTLCDEVAGSRQRLEALVQQPVMSFCYPNGDHDDRVVLAVKQAGYTQAVTTRYGVNRRHTSPWTMRRIDLQGRYGRDSRGQFVEGALLVRLSGRMPGAR